MNAYVFQIQVDVLIPNFKKPWKTPGANKSSGSGFGVQIGNQKFVLTAEHLVKFAQGIVCFKFDDCRATKLKIRDLAPDLDLALLEVDPNEKSAEEFWENMKILKFGKFPKKGDSLHLLGFPFDGYNPRMIRGIFNRVIEVNQGDGPTLLCLETDMSINGGDSGGLILNEQGEIAGMTIGHHMTGEAMGFIVPAMTIEFYLKSVEKFGNFLGVCGFPFLHLNNDNPGVQKYYGIDRGIIVVHNIPVNSDSGFQSQDLIIEIDGIPIWQRGQIFLEDGKVVRQPSNNSEKNNAEIILRNKYPGEEVVYTVIRDPRKNPIKIKTNASTFEPYALVPEFPSRYPVNYFVFGGLIFMTLNFLHIKKIPFFGCYRLQPKLTLDHEIVIFHKVLPDSVNKGYQNMKNCEIVSVNGVEIVNLRQLFELCQECSEPYIKFVFRDLSFIVLDTQEARKKSEELANHYLNAPHHNFKC